MKKAVVFTLSALCATSAFAGATDPGFYAGGGFGLTKSKLNLLDYAHANTLHGDRALRVYGGYQFNRIIAVEGGYTKYGEFKLLPSKGYAWDPSALSVAANLGYTFDNGIRPFATLGFSYLSLNEKGGRAFSDDSGSAFRYGIGLEYSPAQIEGLGVRIAYEADAFNLVDAEDGRSDTFALSSVYLGASYKF